MQFLFPTNNIRLDTRQEYIHSPVRVQTSETTRDNRDTNTTTHNFNDEIANMDKKINNFGVRDTLWDIVIDAIIDSLWNRPKPDVSNPYSAPWSEAPVVVWFLSWTRWIQIIFTYIFTATAKAIGKTGIWTHLQAAMPKPTSQTARLATGTLERTPSGLEKWVLDLMSKTFAFVERESTTVMVILAMSVALNAVLTGGVYHLHRHWFVRRCATKCLKLVDRILIKVEFVVQFLLKCGSKCLDLGHAMLIMFWCLLCGLLDLIMGIHTIGLDGSLRVPKLVEDPKIKPRGYVKVSPQAQKYANAAKSGEKETDRKWTGESWFCTNNGHECRTIEAERDLLLEGEPDQHSSLLAEVLRLREQVNKGKAYRGRNAKTLHDADVESSEDTSRTSEDGSDTTSKRTESSSNTNLSSQDALDPTRTMQAHVPIPQDIRAALDGSMDNLIVSKLLRTTASRVSKNAEDGQISESTTSSSSLERPTRTMFVHRDRMQSDKAKLQEMTLAETRDATTCMRLDGEILVLRRQVIELLKEASQLAKEPYSPSLENILADKPQQLQHVLLKTALRDVQREIARLQAEKKAQKKASAASAALKQEHKAIRQQIGEFLEEINQLSGKSFVLDNYLAPLLAPSMSVEQQSNLLNLAWTESRKECLRLQAEAETETQQAQMRLRGGNVSPSDSMPRDGTEAPEPPLSENTWALYWESRMGLEQISRLQGVADLPDFHMDPNSSSKKLGVALEPIQTAVSTDLVKLRHHLGESEVDLTSKDVIASQALVSLGEKSQDCGPALSPNANSRW
ncbi:hypothetical protein CC79DRAFT_1370341 [Sarocladium strictum]